MTKFNSLLFAAVLFGSLATLGRPAAAIEYPWCAQYGGMDGGGRNCGFSTLAQCMATASGMGGNCQPNLFYEGAVERRAKPKRNRK